MTDVKHVISVANLRTAVEYIKNVIAEAINGRTITVRHICLNGWEPPVYAEDESLLITQSYQVIQNGTILEVS